MTSIKTALIFMFALFFFGFSAGLMAPDVIYQWRGIIAWGGLIAACLLLAWGTGRRQQEKG